MTFVTFAGADFEERIDSQDVGRETMDKFLDPCQRFRPAAKGLVNIVMEFRLVKYPPEV